MYRNIRKTTYIASGELVEQGRRGEAFTLCKPEEIPLVESIEKLLGSSLERIFLDDFPTEKNHPNSPPKHR